MKPSPRFKTLDNNKTWDASSTPFNRLSLPTYYITLQAQRKEEKAGGYIKGVAKQAMGQMARGPLPLHALLKSKKNLPNIKPLPPPFFSHPLS
jgi:hypothetical protein